MSAWRSLPQRTAQAGGIAEALPAIIIGVAVIAGCIWLAINYASSTDKEAQEYAERVVQSLAVNHDANFLAHNLTEKGRLNCGLIRQQELIDNFTRLGVPRRPIKVTGKVTYRTEKGPKEPFGQFRTVLSYPLAQVTLDLAVARRARWGIDGIGTEWKFSQPPSPTPSPTPSASPSPTPEENNPI